MKTTRLDFIVLSVLAVNLGLSLITYKFFGFEIAVLFALSFLTSIVAMTSVGIENILIRSHRKNSEKKDYDL